jgi:hypothetical protein
MAIWRAMVRFGLSWSMLGFLLFGGCISSRPMALEGQKEKLEVGGRSIGLFSLRVTNQYKPTHQAKAFSFQVWPVGSKEMIEFRLDVSYRKAKDQFYEYLASVDLAPGTYTIGNVDGAEYELLMNYKFSFPMDTTFTLTPNAVVYLGHVLMVNRERKGDEPRSGPVVPLVEQSASGYAGGTMDVTVLDRSGEDIPAFVETYPCLQGCAIQKAIMRKR